MNLENGPRSNVDVALEQFAQVTLPADVEQRLEARVDTFCHEPEATKVTRRTQEAVRTRRWFVGASTAASIALLAGAVSFLGLGTRDAWAQVVSSLEAKPWVRFTLQIADGRSAPEGAESPETWLSSEHKVMACKRGLRASFMDLERSEMYFYIPRTNSVTLTTVKDEQLAEFVFIETLRRLVSSEGDSPLSLPNTSIEILEQRHADVVEAGRRWTDFEFQCRNPKRTPSEYQVTIRVDPDSGLPVELRSTEKLSPDQSVPEWKLAIDYPETGPSDIYSMGVPRNAGVHDRRSVETENGEEIEKFLVEYQTSRQKPLEASSVQATQEIAGRILPEESQHIPDELMPDRFGYPDSLLGSGSSPVNNPDCKVTLDRRPPVGPEGTVLVHVLTETTSGSNDCYYWIAPDRDYLVLRYEIHFSGKDHVAWHNQTRIIDEVEQAPDGRWYPSAVRYGRIKEHGDDLSNERVPFDPEAAKNPNEFRPTNTGLLRFTLNFEQP